MQQSIARIHEACQAPPLAPPEYRALFEVMAQELSDNGLAGAQTLTSITERAQDRGINVRREDVQFVLDAVSEADPWYEQGASAVLFAGRFRNFVVARCRSQGLTLSSDELDLIEAWFAGAATSADRRPAAQQAPAQAPQAAAPAPSAPAPIPDFGIPHEAVKLSGMRKTIARRLTESKQQVPHIYLTVDIRLDALLKLRGELNASLEARGVKLSVNDMLIKALGLALVMVPKCNVSFAGDTMLEYSRADISVAVSVPNGLITPIIVDAGNKSISTVSTEMAALAAKAKEGKLQPHEYQGGTASLSNMGMMGIKQFEAVINPPQGMIMAIGAGEKRPYVVDDALAIATVMSATGSFDHRAIDGADGAMLMKVFRELVEKPLGLVA